MMVPAAWSQVAVDVLAQKYCRKAGIPHALKAVPEDGVPEWLWRVDPRRRAPSRYGARRAVRRRARRAAGLQSPGRAAGPTGAGSTTTSTPKTTPASTTTRCARCSRVRSAPPTHRNGSTRACTGRTASRARRKATGTSTGRPPSSRARPARTSIRQATCVLHPERRRRSRQRGRHHGSVGPRSAHLQVRLAARGSNFSKLRGSGEKLSGGGTSSGLMSFLRVGDRAAGAIKSGGTTRRAAKMVVLDADHPDIEKFINWKVHEEQKVADLVAGSLSCEKHLNAIMKAAHDTNACPKRARLDPALNPALETAMRAGAPRGHSAGAACSTRSISRRQGYTRSRSRPTTRTGIRKPTAPSRVRTRTTRFASPTTSSRELDAGENLDLIRAHGRRRCQVGSDRANSGSRSRSRHGSAPTPALQYDTTINEWHTCRADGRINASNPCVTGETLVATADGPQRIASTGRESRIRDRRRRQAAFRQPDLPDGRKAGLSADDQCGLRS